MTDIRSMTLNIKKQENSEGIFLVNPEWIHLDEMEIKERLERGERLFRVNFGESD
jgi:hypothetical protein